MINTTFHPMTITESAICPTCRVPVADRRRSDPRGTYFCRRCSAVAVLDGSQCLWYEGISPTEADTYAMLRTVEGYLPQ